MGCLKNLTIVALLVAGILVWTLGLGVRHGYIDPTEPNATATEQLSLTAPLHPPGAEITGTLPQVEEEQLGDGVQYSTFTKLKSLGWGIWLVIGLVVALAFFKLIGLLMGTGPTAPIDVERVASVREIDTLVLQFLGLVDDLIGR